MYRCDRPHAGLLEAQVAAGVLAGGLRPAFEESCPRELAALMQACWREVPGERPPLADVARELVCVKAEFRRRDRPASAAGAAPARAEAGAV
jgi:hypothetical protein